MADASAIIRARVLELSNPPLETAPGVIATAALRAMAGYCGEQREVETTRQWMRALAAAVGVVLIGVAVLVWWTAEQALPPTGICQGE